MTKPSYKDDLGRYRTQSLFWELRHGVDTSKYPPVFTTKDEDIERDGVEYKSLKKIYMSYDHIPGFEYEFALEHLGSWDHWNKLANDTIPEFFRSIFLIHLPFLLFLFLISLFSHFAPALSLSL